MKNSVANMTTIGVILVMSWPWTNITSAEAPSMDIEQFVRQTFIHGIPYEEATKYAPSVVSELLNMLADPDEEAHWTNIIVTLGMLGDERAVDPLIAFLTKGEGELSQTRFRAKTSALMALGYLTNKTKNEKALTFLKESLNPDVWERRGVTWASPYHENIKDRNLHLSKMAILGLALSAQPSAAESLRSLQKPAENEPARQFRARMSDVVSGALREHELIVEKGLTEYDRTGRTGTPR